MMIAARNAFLMSGGGGLPSGYTAYNYLRRTDGQVGVYIDTGIIAPATGDFLAEVDYATTTQHLLPIGGIGATTTPASRNTGFCLYIAENYRDVYYYAGTTRTIAFKTPTRPSKITAVFGVKNEQAYLRVVNLNTGVVSEQTANLIGTERGNAGNTFRWGLSIGAGAFFGYTVSTARLYASGVVVWDGVPCVRDSDSAVGYYDLVGRNFCPATYGFVAINELT